MRLRKLILVAMIAWATPAWAQNFPKPVGYVNDFAHVLPAENANKLEASLRAYHDTTGIQIAAVTVPSMDDMSVEEYANKLFHQWGIGEKGKDNGILILLAPKERKIRIEVGYGLEADLTDGATGDIIRRYAIPNFQKNNWPTGMEATVAGVITHLGPKPYEERVNERQRNASGFSTVWIVVIVLAVALVIGLIVVSFSEPTKEIASEEESIRREPIRQEPIQPSPVTDMVAETAVLAAASRFSRKREEEKEDEPTISSRSDDDDDSSSSSSSSSSSDDSFGGFGGGDSGGGGASGSF